MNLDCNCFVPLYAWMLSHFSRIGLSVTPWTVACQAPLSMGFSRHEYWRGLSFPSPGDLPDPGIKPASPISPVLAGRFFTTSATREAHLYSSFWLLVPLRYIVIIITLEFWFSNFCLIKSQGILGSSFLMTSITWNCVTAVFLMWDVSFPAHQLLYSWLLLGPCKLLHFGLNAPCKLGSPAQWEWGKYVCRSTDFRIFISALQLISSAAWYKINTLGQ